MKALDTVKGMRGEHDGSLKQKLELGRKPEVTEQDRGGASSPSDPSLRFRVGKLSE